MNGTGIRNRDAGAGTEYAIGPHFQFFKRNGCSTDIPFFCSFFQIESFSACLQFPGPYFPGSTILTDADRMRHKRRFAQFG
jgi:hypothetical protein